MLMVASALPLSLVLLAFTLGAESTVRENTVCDLREVKKAIDGEPDAYLQCVQSYGHYGDWKKQKCNKGEEFSVYSQRCKPHSSIRRQQSLCQAAPMSQSCQQQNCQASNANPYLGGQCNWASAGLQPYQGSSSQFLQCTPASTGSACGTWNQMQCSPGTVYNPTLQVCVSVGLQQQSSCQQNYNPVCPCGQNNACPQSCICQISICCQPPVTQIPPTYTNIFTSPTPQVLPYCRNGQRSISSCTSNTQCPQGYACQNTGCCPLPLCPNGQTSVQACDGQGQSNCQQGYQCQNGACCPLPQCPNGQTAVQSCQTGGYGQTGGTCPQGYSCQNNGCCPLPICQPTGQPAIQSCFGNGQSNCPQSYMCQNNGCCPLPVCPRGGTATQQCSGPGTCSSQQYCVNGGCCPMPTCQNGQTAIQPCDQGSYCPNGYTCQSGGCCPLPPPTCPTGQQASSTCSGPGTCPSTQYCYVDSQGRQGCCNMPTCPDGNTAVQPCSGGQTCPQNMQCINLACCPLPRCPDGTPATQSCANGGYCQQGMVCQNGACCPQPPIMCPNGQVAIQNCGSNGNCPYNYMCQNGGCCPMPPTTNRPLCPNGMPGIQSCSGYGQDCPYGYSCQNGQCCQSTISTPSPMCPNGQSPMQPCGPNNYCPIGYYCYNGQCCYQQQGYTTPQTCVCPQQPICQNCQPQQPQTCQCPPPQQQTCQNCCPITLQICQCASYNNQCPSGSSCNQGACCASGMKKFNDDESQQRNRDSDFAALRPGDGCTTDDQCPGYPATSKCVTGYCVCTGGSRSNGFSCVTYKRRLDPSEVCDQFGSECKYFDRHQRRRPPTSEELGITNETVPLYWHSLNEARCITDNECTPDQMCVQNKCYPFLRPGDFNCKFDEQCNKTCAFSVCVKNTAANITMCQCENGRYEFAHKCWKECPAGTKPKGQICAAGKLETPKVKTFAKRLLSMFSPFQYSLNDDEDGNGS